MAKLADDEVRFVVEQFMGAVQGLAVLTEGDAIARNRLAAYARFLIGDPKYRTYEDLADYLEWYGIRYILPEIRKLILAEGIMYNPFLEFGPGRGWLIGAIAHGQRQSYAIDKRAELYWPRNNVHFLAADVEKTSKLFSGIPGDVVFIANHFLHCLDDPEKFVKRFSWTAPWIVVEPVDGEIDMPYWFAQMALFGAKPITDDYLVAMFEKAYLYRKKVVELPGQLISYFTPFR